MRRLLVLGLLLTASFVTLTYLKVLPFWIAAVVISRDVILVVGTLLVYMLGARVQIVLDAGYTDAYRALHPGETGWTFPTWQPHVRLDYLFVPTIHTARIRSCDVVTSGAIRDASDHFPLLSVIDVPS